MTGGAPCKTGKPSAWPREAAVAALYELWLATTRGASYYICAPNADCPREYAVQPLRFLRKSKLDTEISTIA
jgi:hypothetical protein